MIWEKESKRKGAQQSNDEHYIILDILVGTGIDQQSHTLRVTMRSGINQHRVSELRVRFAARTAPPQSSCESFIRKRVGEINSKIVKRE